MVQLVNFSTPSGTRTVTLNARRAAAGKAKFSALVHLNGICVGCAAHGSAGVIETMSMGGRAGDAVSEGSRRVVGGPCPRIRQTDIESARRAGLADSGPVLLIFKAKGGLAGVVLTVWRPVCCSSPLALPWRRREALSGWPEPPGWRSSPWDAQS